MKIIKPLGHNGFTLLEVMVVLFIVSFLVVPLTTVTQLYRITQFQSTVQLEFEITQTQFKAIATHSRLPLTFRVNNHQVFYNEFGNINQAISGRVSTYNKNIVFYLGFGRYEIQ